MAAELLDWLLRSGLALAVAAALVLALRRLFRRWLGAGAVLWLYLLVPAALVATSLPAPVVVVDAPAYPAIVRTSASPMDAAATAVAGTASPASPGADRPDVAGFESGTEARGGSASNSPASISPAPRALPFDALTVALLAWVAGALALALRMLQQQRRFRRRLGRLVPASDDAWQAETSDTGPVVIGLLRPRIVVPADFEQRYDALQRALVLAHERVHLRRGDLPVNALACALRCLFWFNPLVHLAAAKLRLDQELACDAAVLRHHPRAGRAYATALLNTQLADLGLPVGCAWQSSHPLAWRITMLKKPMPGPTRLLVGAGLALLASSATAAALWQAQPATVVTLPSIATPVAAAPLPALAVDAGMPAPAPMAVTALAPADAPSPGAPVAATPDSAAPLAPLAASPDSAAPLEPVGTSTAAVAPTAPAADPAAPTPVSAPVASPASAGATPAVAPVAPVAPVDAGDHSPARAPLAVSPAARYIQEPAPLPPPRLPLGELPEPPAPTVVAIDANAADADYVPPQVTLAKPARLPKLSGPADALIIGAVLVRVDIDANGKPVKVVVQENQLGDVHARNAIAAVKRWRFEPARRAGVAEPATVLVPVTFSHDPVRVDALAGEAVRHPMRTYLPPPQPIAGQ